MKIPWTTKVGLQPSPTGSCAAANHNLLIMDPTLFNVFNADEKESVLAHEFSHLNNKDVRNQDYLI